MAVLIVGLLVAGLGSLTATPADANPVSDCFDRIAVTFHPHHRAAARPSVRRVRRDHIGTPRAYAYRSRYILRPRACGAHPAGPAMSAIPGEAAPPEDALAALAAPAAPAVAVDAATVAPDAAPAAGGGSDDIAGFPGGGPGGISSPIGLFGLLPVGPAGLVGPSPSPSGAVPEPATWALYIFGLGGVGGVLRRSRWDRRFQSMEPKGRARTRA